MGCLYRVCKTIVTAASLSIQEVPEVKCVASNVDKGYGLFCKKIIELRGGFSNGSYILFAGCLALSFMKSAISSASIGFAK